MQLITSSTKTHMDILLSQSLNFYAPPPLPPLLESLNNQYNHILQATSASLRPCTTSASLWSRSRPCTRRHTPRRGSARPTWRRGCGATCTSTPRLAGSPRSSLMRPRRGASLSLYWSRCIRFLHR